MQKILQNFKKYYILLLNGIVPFLLFFIPVITTSYIDENEKITFFYNFYNLFDFFVDVLFSILCLLIVVCGILSLIFFIIYMFDSYKLILYKKFLNKIILTLSVIITLSSFVLMVYTIYASTKSMSEIFIYYNSFHAGSVILFVYSIIQNIVLIKNFKHKTL